MKTSNQIKLDHELTEFTGTEQYYRHLSGLVYTDGVQFLAATYSTYWLLDQIFFANQPKEIEEFQVWRLQRVYKSETEPTDAFTLTCEDGNKEVLLTRDIPFSDFTADTVTLWFANGVLYLPSEH